MDMKGKYIVKTIHVKDAWKYGLGRFPNFHVSGSVAGMKKLFYGMDAKLVKCGSYIYNVSSKQSIYDEAH